MGETIYPKSAVLLVDDEEAILSAAEIALAVGGITNVTCCSESTRVESLISENAFSVVVLDLTMPKLGGEELVPVIQRHLPDTPIVIATGVDDVSTAVDLMKAGAFDYLTKPVTSHRLVTTVRRAVEHNEICQENASLRQHILTGTLNRPDCFAHVVTDSSQLRSIFGYVEAVAPTSLPVLITGETGVGKELLAEAVHKASGRSGKFVAVNTAGLDDQLFADTLFGHGKGAFTGATSDRKGTIASAAGGTLFLDEIGDLSAESQIKLLRLTQQREYYPLGSDVAVRTDARFVFATNRDLEQLVKERTFRQDLYYRFRSHRIHIPPLRERVEDIPLLARLFLEQAAIETGKAVPTTPPEFDRYLKLNPFPGNVRELEGLIYDAVVRHTSGVLSLDTFAQAIGHEHDSLAPAEAVTPNEGQSLFAGFPRLPHLKEATDGLILEAMQRAEGNQTAAAALLGMTRTALNKRLNRDSGS